MISIYNKDCLQFLKSVPAHSIDCVITDPPYGIEFKSGRRKVKYDKIKNDNSINFMNEVLPEIKKVIKPDAHCYIFCGNQNLAQFLTITAEHLPIKNLLIWEKNNWGMGDLKGNYAPQYELIIYTSNGKRKLNGKRSSNILKYKKTGNKIHPTQKPAELIQFLISKSTNEGETVLDPFSGSGTTAEACIKTNRNFIGCEIDKGYYTTSLQRLKQFENVSIA